MLSGTGVSAGVGIAQALLWHAPAAFDYIPRKCADPSREVDRFEAARRALHGKAASLRQKTARMVGDGEAAIFDAYQMILDDEDGLLQPLRRRIREEQYSAEYAVTTQFDELARAFLQLDSEYMRQRVDDVLGLRDQFMRQLLGRHDMDALRLDRPTVIVAKALSPADVANLDLSRLAGLVCESGGYSSHMAMIARTLGIPAVVGVEQASVQVHNGQLIALDGESGEVWVAPSPEKISMLQHRGEALAEKLAAAQLLRGKPTISTDGRRIELAATVGRPSEVDNALAADAEAVGLYRTELLYAGGAAQAGEEQLVQACRSVLEKMGGKAVTVRTFDDGGNPPPPEQKGREEANPVMGYRGIRMSLGRPSFFRTQLRTLLRASAYGHLRVAFPMVCSVDELDEALEALVRVKEELRREGVPFDEHLQVGVYIEVPSAALMADALAERADFLSVGLSGLIQFTLAIDRNNPSLSNLYHLYHPPVLRLLRHIINAAHQKGKPCMLCGEVPGQEKALPLLLGLGIDGLSVNPSVLLRCRQVLNRCGYAECRTLANNLLALDSAAEVARRLSSLPLFY